MLLTSNSRVLSSSFCSQNSEVSPRSSLLLSGVQELSKQVIFFFHILPRALYKHTVYIEQSTDDMLSITKGHFHMNNQ